MLEHQKPLFAIKRSPISPIRWPAPGTVRWISERQGIRAAISTGAASGKNDILTGQRGPLRLSPRARHRLITLAGWFGRAPDRARSALGDGGSAIGSQ
jgi:hypothetical protein